MITTESGSNFNNDQGWRVDDNEYAFIMCKGRRIDSRRTNPKQLCIPTLMAAPNRGDQFRISRSFDRPIDYIPKQINVILNKNIYCNDPDCMPVVSPLIRQSNFISVYDRANEWFRHRWLDRGARIVVDIQNSNIDHMRVTANEDPSYCDDCSVEHPGCPY